MTVEDEFSKALPRSAIRIHAGSGLVFTRGDGRSEDEGGEKVEDPHEDSLSVRVVRSDPMPDAARLYKQGW